MLQTIVITVDTPDDQQTAVETAAAAAVRGLQDSGVVVTAATFGGDSLLPSPTDALRAAVEALRELTSSGTPTKGKLDAAVTAVDDAARVVEATAADDAARVVEATAADDTAPADAPTAGGFALPDEPAAAPAPSADPAAASSPAVTTAG